MVTATRISMGNGRVVHNWCGMMSSRSAGLAMRLITRGKCSGAKAQEGDPTELSEQVDNASNASGRKQTLDRQGTKVSNRRKGYVNADESCPVSFSDVARAHRQIRNGITQTKCERSYFLSTMSRMEIYLKHEQTQIGTGSFKTRGARNALMTLLQHKDNEVSLRARTKGVIAASAGNHALALAWHGRDLGIPVTVVMPVTAPLAKVNKCTLFGAKIVLHGQDIGEAKDEALSNPNYEGLKYINGFDDPEIIAGAGSLGVELCEQVPFGGPEVVVVPVGGGGLIGGVALAVKTLQPECRVIGVEPENYASYKHALQAGEPQAPRRVLPTLADGLAVPVVGRHAFDVARRYVDEVVTVSERDIALAVLRLVEEEKCIVEGAGATGLAAILPGGPLFDREDLVGKRVAVPLCGGNIDTTILGRVIDRGLAADGRLIRFVAVVSDRPGGIASLTALLAQTGASLKDIYHERAWLHTSVDQVQVKCVIETTSREHAHAVKTALEANGYPLVWGKHASATEQLDDLSAQLM